MPEGCLVHVLFWPSLVWMRIACYVPLQAALCSPARVSPQLRPPVAEEGMASALVT